MDDIAAWFAGRLPSEWFTGEPEVTVDREEIVVVGRLAAPDVAAGASEGAAAAAAAGRATRFREETREQRIRIAQEGEELFDRKVAWGVDCGDSRVLFTTIAVPVMTRLRQPERRTLDTLVEAGIARSRSEALAWSVRLVAQHEGDWIEQLRSSLVAVREARAAGPSL
jgi:Arc/MetJ-type ribon-helix-helix transcriptional regulator